ncbi:MAG: YidC/Oxa1 family membrane protein insertase [Actinomycetota bacterium]|nr:YidC/Oxa1 family membrane protein insertase [Actinomycetota bacterium]
MFDFLEPIAGPLLKGFGWALSGLFSVIPIYGVAIILLTLLVRVILLPLTLKQIRSMQEMQKIQPHVKELQRKYKGNRQKLNEELQKLYREHQVNPLGGCLPLLMQIPVFIALYAVLQATVGSFGVSDTSIRMSEVSGATTICRPDTSPSVGGDAPTEVICEDGSGNRETYEIAEWQAKKSREDIPRAPSEVAVCRPEADPDDDEELGGFLCESRPGPGHLPSDSELYATIVEKGSSFLGMQLSCAPNQAASEVEIRRCAGPGHSGNTAAAIPYYIMVALMAGTTYYQQRQMQRSATGPQAQQMKMMGILMPVFLAFISLQIVAGVLVYWVTTNTWQIAQQAVILRRRTETAPTVKAQAAKSTQTRPKGDGQAKPKGSGQTSKGSGNARNRKKRRKR